MRQNVAITAFNRGVVSDIALARVDIDRIAMSAETQTNWMPRTLGSMMLRPGFQRVTSSRNNAPAVYVPFIFSSHDTALLELTDHAMRVLVNGQVQSTSLVATAVVNGLFGATLAGWTDADEAGAASTWDVREYLALTGTGATAAIRRQTLSVSLADRGVEHAAILVVAGGFADLKIGPTDGSGDWLTASRLGEGTHFLRFTPMGDAHVQLSSTTKYASLVDSFTISGAGETVIPTPWGAADLPNLRWSQSGDIVYLACAGIQQRKIERRAAGSWSVVTYQSLDGPFRNHNTSSTTLAPTGLSGDILLNSSTGIFEPSHIGALFSLDSVGQQVAESISAESVFTSDIRVTGVEATRAFTISITGTFTGTVTLQRSISAPGAWVDVNSYTAATSVTYNDELDNQIIYYRLGIKAGGYTSGTAVARLSYSGGSLTGILRVTDVLTTMQAKAIVLKDLGGTSANTVWAEGAWSTKRGWPSAVSLYEGRLWWAGKGSVYGSVSDAYESFDSEEEGDSGPLNRSIGYGPVDNINWLLPLQRMMIGTDGAEVSARSSSYDEPLTPSNFNLKNAATQGSARVAAVVVDSKGLFLQKSGTRVYELDYDVQRADYASADLTVLCPDIGEPSILRMAVQRQPDTRIHCVRADGKVAVLVFDRAESVICWVLVETDGFVEEVAVLPGVIEDEVYYLVRREIDGATRRYLEKWAKESECQGGLLNRQADSFVIYEGSATTAIGGLNHLEGKTVVAWADGKDAGQYTVASGTITLSAPASKVVVGLPYTAQFKSTKLAYAASMGTALTQRKRVDHLGFILKNTHALGLQYGPNFDSLNDLPGTEGGAIVDSDHIWPNYDFDSIEFGGEYNTDSRVCLQASAPRPATVLACTISITTHDK